LAVEFSEVGVDIANEVFDVDFAVVFEGLGIDEGVFSVFDGSFGGG
jgi:hypothetical protein